MNKSKLISFVATVRPTDAKRFYKETLDLKLVDDSPFGLVFNANGTMLRVQKVQKLTPAQHTTLGWDVRDIRATVAELCKKGVRFERYDGMSQDALGIWATPDGSFVAWFKDPDGNTLSLTEFQ